MTWVLPAILAAFFVASADGLTKRYFAELPLPQAVLMRFSGLGVAGVVILLWLPWPQLKPEFYICVALALPVEVLASFLYIRAIQISPLALTLPFTAFTPFFSMFTGYFFLSEFPNYQGFLGVGLLVAGVYGLNLHKAKTSWVLPFKAVFKEQGSWMMLLVGLLYAYTAVLGRKAVLLSNVWFMAGFYPLLLCLLLGVGFFLKRDLKWSVKGKIIPYMGISLCMVAMALSHFYAISMVQTAYMVAVKRMSILFAVTYGAVFLKEGRFAQHFLACVLVFMGGFLIVLWG